MVDTTDPAKDQARTPSKDLLGSRSASKTKDNELTKREANWIKWLLIAGIFQAVMQHVSALQTDVALFSRALLGNEAATSRALATSNAFIGVFGLFLNQIGGWLSDSLGRKPFFILGPLVNIICASGVLRTPENVRMLIVGRILRSLFITFSGTVMCQAAVADLSQHLDLPRLSVEIQAAVGVAVIVGPMLESAAIKSRRGGVLAPFKVLRFLSILQLFHYSLLLPETLLRKKPIDVKKIMNAINPFSFLKLYFGKDSTLKKMITIQCFQFCTDGKVTSDLFQMWAKNNLKWTSDQIRNMVVAWGATNTAVSALIHPYMLKGLSAYAYTTIGNVCVAAGLATHGLAERGICMWAGIPIMAPGCNGAAAHAIKSLCTRRAIKNGYGNGEYSAWINNMRALMQSIQIIILGMWYARCRERGAYAGSAWFIASLVGGALPQLIMMTMKREDFGMLTDKK